MFLLTQFIGLFVISSHVVPNYLDAQVSDQEQLSYGYYFFNIIVSLAMAVLIFVLITKYKLVAFMRIWFLVVLTIALSISLSAIIKLFGLNSYWIALIIAIPLGILKLVRPSIIIHNGTELLIYPGLAAVFAQILSPLYAILFLLLISIYDFWAVWHSGLMQRMAKFQMNEMKVFGGFYIPYLTKELREKIQKMKIKFRGKKINKKIGIKVPIAILGGGDIVFPIITAGVFMNAFNSIAPAIAIILGAFAGLTYLLMVSHKKKFYPAMVYITPGILIGLAIWFLLRYFSLA
ncbi:Signal-peptide peptidase, presenilin aspartyl protease [uncultured archaeon]|nr:Signal-peptide peptidase, presenilin aspartyl protease [uncultured archaeon]